MFETKNLVEKTSKMSFFNRIISEQRSVGKPYLNQLEYFT